METVTLISWLDSAPIQRSQEKTWWKLLLPALYRITSVSITTRITFPERLNNAEIFIGNSTENNGINNPSPVVRRHQGPLPLDGSPMWRSPLLHLFDRLPSLHLSHLYLLPFPLFSPASPCLLLIIAHYGPDGETLWHLLIPRSLDVSAVNREISGARRSGAQAQRPTSAQRRRLRVHQQRQQQHHSHPSSSSGRKEYIHTPALSPVF
ncbi:hypothetical protein KUCAC02_000967 [Chaenocephalus aceratus]|uniref:Uncharacterized protein n=1 Tax=Chaenocephalus aceratus TaxID=36190 RepID=A0ACB9XWS5_CHAAC|nr:hypothetical protein KUCAC02_000967 [Chaenocephalus aceratus]